jgi:aryl sulfotransferase
MKILQSGAPKCGNFWLYQIIQKALKLTGNHSPGHIEQHPIYELAKTWDLNFPDQAKIDVLEITDLQLRYRISSIFQMPILDFPDYLSKSNHVWTHSPICKRSGEVFRQMDKIVYIIRDPRDRAISAAKYYCSDYMLKYFPQEEGDASRFLYKNFDHLLREWVWHVWDHLRLSKTYDIHITFYENWLEDFQSEFQRLLHYLELTIPEEKQADLEDELSFATLKKTNPNHLRKGSSGYWLDMLTEEQVARAETIAGPLMAFLHYGLDVPYFDKASATPELFADIREDLIQNQKVLH